MTSAGSVGGDERLRLFLALELPPATLDDLIAWGSANLSGGRIVAREHLHVTLAFLGSRPAVEVDAIVRVLRDAVAAGSEPIVLEPTRWRETRSVGMLVLADQGGAATGLAAPMSRRPGSARRLPAGGAAVAAARHAASLPRAAASGAPTARDGNIRSVRRGCLPVSTAPDRSPVRGAGTRLADRRRMIR